MANRDTELRSKWWTRPVGHIAWFFITLICFTLRKRIIVKDNSGVKPGHRPVIVALWHNRTFPPCYVYRYVLHGPVMMSMLTSASKDGALLTTVANDYGMRTVRGSSNRRGIAGFMDMVAEVKNGCSMCITPDGPKGPIYRSHNGVIKLAQLSGVPIIPLCIDMPNCWRITKAWDGYAIPKPFSRLNLLWGEPIEVPAELDDAGVELYARKLDAALAYGRPDFGPLPE